MKTTIREFAQKNDLALPRLRRLLNKHNDNVKITHTSKGVNYYDSVNLDTWLITHKKHFSDTAKYVHLGMGELFYCIKSNHYANKDRLGKKPNCCADCEKIPLTLTKKPVAARGKLTQDVIDLNERRERISKARELKAINEDGTSWMNNGL